jgi:hypothetical protein
MPTTYNVFGIWDDTINSFIHSAAEEEKSIDEAELKDWFYSTGAEYFHSYNWKASYDKEVRSYLKKNQTYPPYNMFQVLGIKSYAFLHLSLQLSTKLQDELLPERLCSIMMSFNAAIFFEIHSHHLFYQLEAIILSSLGNFHAQFENKPGKDYNLERSAWTIQKFEEAKENPKAFLPDLDDNDEKFLHLQIQIDKHIQFIKPSGVMNTPSFSSRSLSPRRIQLPQGSPAPSSRSVGISIERFTMPTAGTTNTPPLGLRKITTARGEEHARDVSDSSHGSTPKSTNSGTGPESSPLRISTKGMSNTLPRQAAAMTFFSNQQRQSSQQALLSPGTLSNLTPITGSSGSNGSPGSPASSVTAKV